MIDKAKGIRKMKDNNNISQIINSNNYKFQNVWEQENKYHMEQEFLAVHN